MSSGHRCKPVARTSGLFGHRARRNTSTPRRTSRTIRRLPAARRSVQVKATGRRSTKNKIAFSYSETHADHLLVIELDFDRGIGRAVYNGPEHYVRAFLPSEPWKGQKQVSLSQLRQAAARVRDAERLPMVRADDRL
jgi:hypothetical protein